MSDTRIDDLLDELVPPFAPSGHGWDDVLARAHSVRKRYALVAVAAFALALVPTAIAFRGRITDLFRGTPAPPAVTTSFEANNRIADLPTQKGFRDKFPRVDVSRIRGLLEIQTADGPQDVWAARTSSAEPAGSSTGPRTPRRTASSPARALAATSSATARWE
jgi:hypothetical protein